MSRNVETSKKGKNHNWLAVVLLISNLLITWFAAVEIENYVAQWAQPLIGLALVLVIALNAIGWFRHYR